MSSVPIYATDTPGIGFPSEATIARILRDKMPDAVGEDQLDCSAAVFFNKGDLIYRLRRGEWLVLGQWTLEGQRVPISFSGYRWESHDMMGGLLIHEWYDSWLNDGFMVCKFGKGFR